MCDTTTGAHVCAPHPTRSRRDDKKWEAEIAFILDEIGPEILWSMRYTPIHVLITGSVIMFGKASRMARA